MWFIAITVVLIVGLVVHFVQKYSNRQTYISTLAKNMPAAGKSIGDTAEETIVRERVFRVIRLTISYIFLVILGIFMIFPFYWMVITSLKTEGEISLMVPTFFPKVLALSNIPNAIIRLNAWRLLYNTITVGIWSTVGTLITTVLAAFAFSRIKFPGREFVFTLFLGTMMIPGEMMVITNYLTVAKMGLLESKAGAITSMIIPFWVSVFYIFQLRQNFKQIPNELYYAAKVDGKTDWQYLWKVMVPLASPALITIFILKLMGTWNSYIWPNLVANQEDWRLITNGLRSYSPSPSGEPHQGLQMAATFVVTVPLLLLFIFFRKYIMRGVGRAGLKG